MRLISPPRWSLMAWSPAKRIRLGRGAAAECSHRRKRVDLGHYNRERRSCDGIFERFFRPAALHNKSDPAPV